MESERKDIQEHAGQRDPDGHSNAAAGRDSEKGIQGEDAAIDQGDGENKACSEQNRAAGIHQEVTEETEDQRGGQP